MKKTKIIVPALGMLLLSTAASVTGTVAWFSANSQVTATGMTVSAKSDSKLLVINFGESFDASGEATTATSTHAATQLFPVAPAVSLTSANVETAGSWHYAYSSSTATATASGSYTACTSLTNYVVSESVFIGLNTTSGLDTASNLKLTAVTLPTYGESQSTGVSVVVVCGTNCYTHTTSATSLTEALATSVGKTGVEVKLYYFINGEDANVYTNNISHLTGAVSLTFNID